MYSEEERERSSKQASEWVREKEQKKLKKHPHSVLSQPNQSEWVRGRERNKKKNGIRCKRWGQKETKKRFITKLNFWQKLLLYCTHIHTYTYIHLLRISLTFLFISWIFLFWNKSFVSVLRCRCCCFPFFLALGYIIFTACCFEVKNL